MNRQKTLAKASTFGKYKKTTRREKFLAEMERVTPWKELDALLDPFYPKASLDLTRTRGTKNKKLTGEDKEANRLLPKREALSSTSI